MLQWGGQSWRPPAGNLLQTCSCASTGKLDRTGPLYDFLCKQCCGRFLLKNACMYLHGCVHKKNSCWGVFKPPWEEGYSGSGFKKTKKRVLSIFPGEGPLFRLVHLAHPKTRRFLRNAVSSGTLSVADVPIVEPQKRTSCLSWLALHPHPSHPTPIRTRTLPMHSGSSLPAPWLAGVWISDRLLRACSGWPDRRRSPRPRLETSTLPGRQARIPAQGGRPSPGMVWRRRRGA